MVPRHYPVVLRRQLGEMWFYHSRLEFNFLFRPLKTIVHYFPIYDASVCKTVLSSYFRVECFIIVCLYVMDVFSRQVVEPRDWLDKWLRLEWSHRDFCISRLGKLISCTTRKFLLGQRANSNEVVNAKKRSQSPGNWYHT